MIVERPKGGITLGCDGALVGIDPACTARRETPETARARIRRRAALAGWRGTPRAPALGNARGIFDLCPACAAKEAALKETA